MTTRDSKSSASDKSAVGSRGTGLRELSAKWRKEARADAKHGVAHALKSNREHFGGVNYALAKSECADQLDAALSALPLEEGLRGMLRPRGQLRVGRVNCC